MGVTLWPRISLKPPRTDLMRKHNTNAMLSSLNNWTINFPWQMIPSMWMMLAVAAIQIRFLPSGSKKELGRSDADMDALLWNNGIQQDGWLLSAGGPWRVCLLWSSLSVKLIAMVKQRQWWIVRFVCLWSHHIAFIAFIAFIPFRCSFFFTCLDWVATILGRKGMLSYQNNMH